MKSVLFSLATFVVTVAASQCPIIGVPAGALIVSQQGSVQPIGQSTAANLKTLQRNPLNADELWGLADEIGPDVINSYSGLDTTFYNGPTARITGNILFFNFDDNPASEGDILVIEQAAPNGVLRYPAGTTGLTIPANPGSNIFLSASFFDSTPVYVGFNPYDSMYYTCLRDANDIKRFTSTGTFVDTNFGSPFPGPLTDPLSLAFESSGRIWTLSRSGNEAVARFYFNGQLDSTRIGGMELSPVSDPLVPGRPRAMVLSDDQASLYIASGTYVYVIDTVFLTISETIDTTLYGDAISLVPCFYPSPPAPSTAPTPSQPMNPPTTAPQPSPSSSPASSPVTSPRATSASPMSAPNPSPNPGASPSPNPSAGNFDSAGEPITTRPPSDGCSTAVSSQGLCSGAGTCVLDGQAPLCVCSQCYSGTDCRTFDFDCGEANDRYLFSWLEEFNEDSDPASGLALAGALLLAQ